MNINAYACILYYEQGIEKKMMIINMLKYCLYCRQGIFYSQFIFPQIVFSVTGHTSIQNGVYIISVYM